MIRDLSTFGIQQTPPEPPAPCRHQVADASKLMDRTILITRGDHPLTSWQRAWTVAMETRQRYPAVWIVSNGSMDTPATEWWIRGVVEATN